MKDRGKEKVLLTYASGNYRKAQRLNVQTGKWIAGFDRTIECGPEDIEEDFQKAHEDIFAYARGNGLWLWKPYLLLKTLEELEEGSLLVYLDAGAFWARSAQPVFEILERENLYVSDLPLVEKQFSKAYVFDRMQMTEEQIRSQQIQGTIIGVKKCGWTVAFIKEWLRLCCDAELLAPDRNPQGLDETFIAHREDQSILSCLCKTRGIKPHKDPTQYGMLPQKYRGKDFILSVPVHNDGYKAMIALHRSGNCDKRICLNQWLCCVLPVRLSKKFIKS